MNACARVEAFYGCGGKSVKAVNTRRERREEKKRKEREAVYVTLGFASQL